ncbi:MULTISPECIES: hypothetical protein [unclassified Vibrio]|uniref:hypothetical protein n=1 Tax=unclassified Vibrio TaxID=2614977 RepID=UPI000C84BCD3|nr:MULTISPECIES: hypothetical protein [unclassified Vibrio]PMK74865.1 hypothetical protein BCT92_23755 [Vibrio sp. 10N.261.52.E5]TKF78000.1 hypothetical protein FCV65_24085 [Vibrio sp. F13]
MINKDKNKFTQIMILKSEEILDQDAGIEMDFKMFLSDEAMNDLSPSDHSAELMYHFQNGNELRPEILLNRDSDISKAAFPTEEHYQSFCDDLTKYQDDEQVLLLNRDNGLEIDEKLLDDSAVMKFRNPSYVEEVDKSRIEEVEKVLDKAYSNTKVLPQSELTKMYQNGDTYLPEIALAEGFEVPDFEELKVNPDLPNDVMILGQEAPNIDLLNVAANVDDTYNVKDKNKEELDEVKMKTVAEHYAEMKKEQLSPYEAIGNVLYREGKRKIEFDNRFMGNKLNRACKRAYLSATPEAQDIVTGLTMVKPRNVFKFPYSEENLESFRQALIQIRDEDKFDINEIKLNKNKKMVDPAFHKILEEVKNAPKMVLGEGLENDEENLVNKNNAVLGGEEPKQAPVNTTGTKEVNIPVNEDNLSEIESQEQKNTSKKESDIFDDNEIDVEFDDIELDGLDEVLNESINSDNSKKTANDEIEESRQNVLNEINDEVEIHNQTSKNSNDSSNKTNKKKRKGNRYN